MNANTYYVYILSNQFNNVLYIGVNPNNPSIGDVRVTYKKVLPGDVSILAVVNGNTFEKFTAKNGYSMMTLEDGIVGMDNMFANEHSSNKTMAWILRLIGILLCVFGFKNIFNIITQLLKVLPFLGNIANLGVGLVSWVLGLAWSLIVIAVAWLFYRPLLGILLLLIAGCLIWFLGKKSKEKKAQLDAQAAPAPAAAPIQPAAPAPAPAPEPKLPEPPAPDFSDAPAPPPEFPDAPVE